jgi:hypothetical protein
MTAYHSRLLGFDVRLSSEEYLSAHWNEESRLLYLLRPAVEWPLSVDTVVLPSVFFPKVYGTEVMIPVDPETETYGYWLNLQAMRVAFSKGWKRSTRGIFIGIHLVAAEGLTSDQFGSRVLEAHPAPQECPKGSDLLGYDVADSGLTSALCSCGYITREEKNRWQAEWEQHLNGFGLLKTQDLALEFRETSDRRVPEHAPFYVFGLWKLPER